MSVTAVSERRKQPVRPSDSARDATRAGWLIIILFFGFLGIWAATAPLNAAVVGDAVVKVEGNRKSVQHLDGGTVKEILIAEGDHVSEGDVVVVLDDTVTRAEVDILESQETVLRATVARLEAEYSQQEAVSFPADLLGTAAMDDQHREFQSRRNAMASSQAVLDRRIDRYKAQIDGLNAQRAPLEQQLTSVTAERVSLEELLRAGLTTRPRVLELERRESGLAGQINDINFNVNIAEQAIAETEQQMLQLIADRSAEISAELRDVSSKLADIAPRLQAASAALERSEVRTPYAGTVVDLTVFSRGAVIGRGERLMDIVPDDVALDVEARIRVEDISDVKPGMAAEIHFTSYKQRAMPLIHGTVSEVSADRLTDERTQIPYYVARLAVDRDELAASPEIQLYPGMPATVMITTQARTALDYILGPLTASFDRSFRER